MSDMDTTGAPEPDRALTVPPRRLAGSPACLNCGTPLQGPFCYYCGQPDRNFLRFFPALLRELLEDVLEFDSRFMRTMKPLLFKPGRLTRDYLEGRRFRYTPPLRLYLFSSIAFFVVAAVLSTNAIELSIDRDRDGAPVVTMRGDDEARVQKAREALEELPPEIREQLQIDPDELLAQPPPEQDQEKAWFKVSDIQLNGQPWDRETNPVDIRWLPDWVNRRLNDEIEKSPDKAREINRNPNLIVEQVFDILPATMFILLPAVALLFKFWYLFARRYYIEHLIFALHNHSFLFVSLLLILGLSLLAGWLETSGALLAAQAASWLLIAISVWIPLYLLISLRHVYRQNWFLTLFKFGVIGISYITLLGIVTSIVALLGFVLL
jgi:hypothetical protein